MKDATTAPNKTDGSTCRWINFCIASMSIHYIFGELVKSVRNNHTRDKRAATDKDCRTSGNHQPAGNIFDFTSIQDTHFSVANFQLLHICLSLKYGVSRLPRHRPPVEQICSTAFTLPLASVTTCFALATVSARCAMIIFVISSCCTASLMKRSRATSR